MVIFIAVTSAVGYLHLLLHHVVRPPAAPNPAQQPEPPPVAAPPSPPVATDSNRRNPYGPDWPTPDRPWLDCDSIAREVHLSHELVHLSCNDPPSLAVSGVRCLVQGRCNRASHRLGAVVEGRRPGMAGRGANAGRNGCIVAGGGAKAAQDCRVVGARRGAANRTD